VQPSSLRFFRLSLVSFDADAEYNQGLLTYDVLYLLIMIAILCCFVVIAILLYKNKPTMRLTVGSLFLGEVIVLAIVHRVAYIVASFGVNHIVFEFVIFLYRFFGFGINLWVLIFFWGKKDIYDEGYGEIESINDSVVEDPAQNQVFEQI